MSMATVLYIFIEQSKDLKLDWTKQKITNLSWTKQIITNFKEFYALSAKIHVLLERAPIISFIISLSF